MLKSQLVSLFCIIIFYILKRDDSYLHNDLYKLDFILENNQITIKNNTYHYRIFLN